MSDRIKGLTVILDKNYRDDDCEEIIKAISMIKGVLEVKSKIVKSDDYFLRSRFRHEMKQNIFDMLDKEVGE